jgi:hypothetical protein
MAESTAPQGHGVVSGSATKPNKPSSDELTKPTNTGAPKPAQEGTLGFLRDQMGAGKRNPGVVGDSK